MSPLIEPLQTSDPQGRSYGLMADDTARSGLPGAVFAKQEILLLGSPSAGGFKLSVGNVAEVDTLTPQESGGAGGQTLTGGSVAISLTWNGVTYTTGPVAFGASNAELEAAVNGAVGPRGQKLPVSACAVSAGPLKSAATKLTFLTAMGPVTNLSVTAVTALTYSGGAAKVAVVRSTSGTVETTAQIPITYNVKGEATAPTAAEVATALKGLTAIGASGVSVTGGASGGVLSPLVVTFAGTLTGPRVPILATNELTTGSTYSETGVQVNTVSAGQLGTSYTSAGAKTTTAFSVADLETLEATAEATVITGAGCKISKLTLEVSNDGVTFFKLGSEFATWSASGSPVTQVYHVAGWKEARWGLTTEGTVTAATLVIATAGKLTGNA